MYKNKGFNREPIIEARAFITNRTMCSYLYEELGIQPRRSDPTKVIEHIPKEFYRYFILGVFDGDGSFAAYQASYGKKLGVDFGGSEQLLRFIEHHLIEQGLIDNIERKLYQRHKGADGTWRTLSFAGVPQGMKILNYLYKDSVIHLDRKYEKYLAIPYHNN